MVLAIRKPFMSKYWGKRKFKCESACGDNPGCDEESPGASLSDSYSATTLEVNRNCDNNCAYSSITYTCDSSHCGEEHDCGGQIY